MRPGPSVSRRFQSVFDAVPTSADSILGFALAFALTSAYYPQFSGHVTLIGRYVNLGAVFDELFRLLGHAFFGELPHLLRDLHRAEMRTAHRAKMGDFGALCGQRLVVELTRRLGIQRKIELIFPAEIEARLAQDVVPVMRERVSFGQIGGVRRNFVGNDPVFDILLVRQAEMLFGRDVTEHRRAVPADHRRTDRTGDVIVPRRDVGNERPERVERRFFTDLELLVHVLFDEVHWNVSGAFDHDLHVVSPRNIRELAQRFELGELRRIVRIRGASRTQPVAQRERDVVRLHNLADLFEMRVEEVLLVMREAPLRQNGTAAGNDSGDAICRQRHVPQQNAGMNGKVIYALLRLFDERVAVQFPGEFFSFAVNFLERLINRYGSDGHGRIAQNPFARFVDVFY